MTRYNDYCAPFYDLKTEHVKDYQEGVDRVLTYIESIHAYPKLLSELRWAIQEGII